ncbi:Protein CBG26798 [Caenorhabditis briggsae]|nr:Protein CBG26798 [Caenorhabditis briggsae]CAR99514.1 Protein CBG26798 [Caenorhabditis briggsae]
MSWESA